MDRKALLSIFLQQKDELMQKIAQAASARDLEGVRSTIARFFDTQLSPSGEYASQLTQAEFFILQSSSFVYNLQQRLYEQFILTPEQEATETSETKVKVTSSPMAFAYSILGGLGYLKPLAQLRSRKPLLTRYATKSCLKQPLLLTNLPAITLRIQVWMT